MTASVCRLLILAILFACIVLPSDVECISVHVPPNFGCSNGRKDGLLRHQSISACRGTWSGHIEKAQLCSVGWHVCNINDTEKLSAITYYEASHIEGCYAFNVAHNNGACSKCTSELNEMVGVGADCPVVNSELRSCYHNGKIAATYSDRPGVLSCGYRPWINGVVCCKDKMHGTTPTFQVSPKPSVSVPFGTKIVLSCKASGKPTPKISWYKNAYPLSMDDLINEVTMEDDVTTSTLTIRRAAVKFDGLYICQAENSNGIAISYSSDVSSYNPMPKLSACKSKEKQQLLLGGKVAACEGKWTGSVKRSSKQLCAKGWRVCGLKDRNTLHKITWTEATSLTGCYAYDAATSLNFACTSCSNKKKGNSMSGMGSGCGTIDQSRTSCLNTGLIDVWSDGIPSNDFDIPAPGTKRSCRYQKGYTTGVLCCKNSRKGGKRKKSRKCPTPCGQNSHCTRRRVCKCDRGFKALGNACVLKPKRKSKRCSKVKCQNGGRCKRGKCKCLPAYTGSRCEKAVQSDTGIN